MSGAVEYTAPCDRCGSDAAWIATSFADRRVYLVTCPSCDAIPIISTPAPAEPPNARPSWAWIRTLSLVLTRMLVTAERSHTR